MAEISAAGDAPDLSPSTHEENARISTSETGKPPLLSFAMLRRAVGVKIFSLDKSELSPRVYVGFFLKDDKEQGEAKNDKEQGEAKNGEDQELPYTHKYWVDKDLNKSCWMVLAKTLSITWGNDSQCWTWPEEEESCYWGKENLPVAVLGGVCWLEIKGKCKTIMLSPWTMYEVAIVVKMSRRNEGWKMPVNLSLEVPDGNKQARVEILDDLKKETWIPIRIGKFETTPNTVGEISFSLTQTDGHWKSGLRVKGVVITPAAENKQPK